VGKLHERLQETEQKLEESKELLKTNENVISWLNKQLNETHSVGSNRSNAPFRATVSPNQMPERIPCHSTHINYPLPSYPVTSFLPVPVSSHQPLDINRAGQRVHHNNPLAKLNRPQSLSGPNKEKATENIAYTDTSKDSSSSYSVCLLSWTSILFMMD
ncbi:hypothetical protein AB205_0052590, partial [Aquarana catesbeiana]